MAASRVMSTRDALMRRGGLFPTDPITRKVIGWKHLEEIEVQVLLGNCIGRLSFRTNGERKCDVRG